MPNKRWKTMVMNSANVISGIYTIRIGEMIKTFAKEEFENNRSWLEDHKFIVRNGDISDEVLQEVYKNPEKYFG